MVVADNTLKDNSSELEILCWSYFCNFYWPLISHIFCL